MSEIAVQPSAVHPFHEPSRGKRLIKVGAWLVGIALVVVLLNVLGIDVVGWLSGSLGRDQGHSGPLPGRGAHACRPARRSSPGSPTTASCARPIRARSSSGRS